MSQYPHLYNTTRWRKIRRMKLNTDPLCAYCKQMGRHAVATVVDHIKPHRGDYDLFHEWGNLQSLCKPCHDSAAAVKDRLGYVPGVGVDGLPLDPGHEWYKQ
jgi:5-methylcytosine-specific restriction enzyme A